MTIMKSNMLSLLPWGLLFEFYVALLLHKLKCKFASTVWVLLKIFNTLVYKKQVRNMYVCAHASVFVHVYMLLCACVSVCIFGSQRSTFLVFLCCSPFWYFEAGYLVGLKLPDSVRLTSEPQGSDSLSPELGEKHMLSCLLFQLDSGNGTQVVLLTELSPIQSLLNVFKHRIQWLAHLGEGRFPQRLIVNIFASEAYVVPSHWDNIWQICMALFQWHFLLWAPK